MSGIHGLRLERKFSKFYNFLNGFFLIKEKHIYPYELINMATIHALSTKRSFQKGIICQNPSITYEIAYLNAHYQLFRLKSG